MSETFDTAFRDHQNREAELQELEDAERAKEIERQITILEPFWLWLASEFPTAVIGDKVVRYRDRAFFEFATYFIQVKDDGCIGDDDSGIIEWIYQKFLDKR